MLSTKIILKKIIMRKIATQILNLGPKLLRENVLGIHSTYGISWYNGQFNVSSYPEISKHQFWKRMTSKDDIFAFVQNT